jgi:hypothetical protein
MIIPLPQGRIDPVANGVMITHQTATYMILANGQLVPNAPSNKTITPTPSGMTMPVTVDVTISMATQETQGGTIITAHQLINVYDNLMVKTRSRHLHYETP